MIPRPRATSWVSYAPNTRQRQFHTVPAVGPMMVKGYIGAFGGGKSTAIEQEMTEQCLKMPNGLSIAARKSKKRADLALIRDFQRILDGIAKWRKNDELFEFANGHKLALLPGDTYERFGSTDICQWFLQEAHELTDPQIFGSLNARLRDPAGQINGRPYYRGYLDARGITSSHWINQKFISKAWSIDSGPEKRARAENPDFVYIRCRTEDNRENLRPGYIEELRRQNADNPNWIRVFLEGEVGFDVEGKAVFSDSWDYQRHVAAISEDTSLPILRSWDFGFRAPAVTWSQYTHSGRLLILRELCPRDLSTDELIQQAHALQHSLWPQRPRYTYRDFGDIAGEQIASSASSTDVEKVEQYFGTAVESRKARIEDGLNVIRKLMRDGVSVAGKNVSRFAVDESCITVIEACSGAYYYPEDKLDQAPKKGLGYDAPIDTIRYVAQLIVEEGYVAMPTLSYQDGRRTPGLYAKY